MGQFSRALSYQQKALGLRREMNDKHGEHLSLMNLGIVALYMGQYDKSLAHLNPVLTWYQEAGNSQGEAESLVYLALLHHQMGQSPNQAMQYCQAALKITQKIGARLEEAVAWRVLGHIYFGDAVIEEAKSAYRESLEICREIGNENVAQEALAGLLAVALWQNDRQEMQTLAEEILEHLAFRNLHGADEPLYVYSVCITALARLQDPRAQKLKRQALEFLRQRADSILDEEEQQIYLDLPHHQEALAAGAASKLPDDD
jgi:tetratricopeptide (TPR) repeat protein